MPAPGLTKYGLSCMMTGTLSPEFVSLGRMMSTRTRSFFPSPSLSTDDCTRTYSRMASW